MTLRSENRGARRAKLRLDKRPVAGLPGYECLLAMLATMVAAAAMLMPARCIAANISATRTRIITYVPRNVHRPVRSGYCWTESIASPRTDAWRCMAGNAIYDPCFTNPQRNDEMICDPDPAADKPGFALKLTRPLPKSAGLPAGNTSPWLIELADGSVCRPFTGTLPLVKHLIIRYGCSDSKACSDGDCPHLTGVIDGLGPGKLWTARKVTYAIGRAGPKLIKTEPISVIRAWR